MSRSPRRSGHEGRSSRHRSAGDREPLGPRRIGGSDIVALLLGGAIILGLVGYNLSLHGRISEMRRSEQIAWDQANGLEEQLATLQEGVPGGGRAERWASVLEAPGVRSVGFDDTGTDAWGRGFYAPEARRLLLVLRRLPVDQGALMLASGEAGALELRGALDVDPSGHVVVCLDGVDAPSWVRITLDGADAAPTVVLDGRIP